MRWLAMIFMVMIASPFAYAVVADNGVFAESASNFHATVIAGKYFPYDGGLGLPEGTIVDLECRDDLGTKYTTTTTLNSDQTFNEVLLASDCTVGDEVQACIENECSEWSEVESADTAGWGVSFPDIFGVPEYTTVGAGLLVLLTGGSIAYLRRKKF